MMPINRVAVQETAEFVKIRPESSILWTVVSTTEYNALLPDCNVDPGYCLKKTIKTKKLTSVTDFQLGKIDIFFRDNQVWLDFYKLHPSKHHKEMFERFSMTKSVQSAIKLPFVPLCLDNYDIARIWQSWFLTDLKIEINIQTLLRVTEVIKNGKESC